MNRSIQSRRVWFLLLCCLGLLTGCNTAEPASEPGSSSSAFAPAEETPPPAESSQDPGADPEAEAAVSVTGYLFDQQILLDEMNRALEQYSRLSPEAERFPQRSVEVMRMMQWQFEAMAALTPPEGYEEVVPLAEEAASTMEEVAGLVEQAFAAGLDTQEGADRLASAQQKFSGAVTALEEITALLGQDPDELLASRKTE